ncbi:hypothetical protein GQ53DRAFT_91956 [Thozetella sp. PMI_491]|nr:hypothetical protein GQ53DRAFT_91956 [Thozetella sp. PMI_491]
MSVALEVPRLATAFPNEIGSTNSSAPSWASAYNIAVACTPSPGQASSPSHLSPHLATFHPTAFHHAFPLRRCCCLGHHRRGGPCRAGKKDPAPSPGAQRRRLIPPQAEKREPAEYTFSTLKIIGKDGAEVEKREPQYTSPNALRLKEKEKREPQYTSPNALRLKEKEKREPAEYTFSTLKIIGKDGAEVEKREPQYTSPNALRLKEKEKREPQYTSPNALRLKEIKE